MRITLATLAMLVTLTFANPVEAATPKWYTKVTAWVTLANKSEKAFARCPQPATANVVRKCAATQATNIGLWLGNVEAFSTGAEVYGVCVRPLKSLETISIEGFRLAVAFSRSQPKKVAANSLARSMIVRAVAAVDNASAVVADCLAAR
jgi:hypothetical protein